jgi:hypothetical protein
MRRAVEMEAAENVRRSSVQTDGKRGRQTAKDVTEAKKHPRM